MVTGIIGTGRLSKHSIYVGRLQGEETTTRQYNVCTNMFEKPEKNQMVLSRWRYLNIWHSIWQILGICSCYYNIHFNKLSFIIIWHQYWDKQNLPIVFFFRIFFLKFQFSHSHTHITSQIKMKNKNTVIHTHIMGFDDHLIDSLLITSVLDF